MIRELWRAARKRQGSFAIGSVITIAFNGLAIALYGGASILVARVSGPEEWGRVVWFISATSSLSMFADVFGVFFSNAYLTASKRGQVDQAAGRSAVLLYGAGAGLLLGGLAALAPVRAVLFTQNPEAMWAIIAWVNILGLAVVAQVRGILVGSQRFIALGIVTLLKSATFAAIALVLAYGLHRVRAVDLVIGHVASTWSCVVVSGFYVWRLGLKRPDWRYLAACARMGWRGAGVSWLSFLHQRIDQYLVDRTLGSAALGLYGVAVNLGELATQVPAMLGAVMFPIAAAESNVAVGARRTLLRTAAVMGIVFVVMAVVGYFAPWLVQLLYGPRYAGSAVLLRYLTPAIVCLSGLLLVNQHVGGLGYPVFQLAAMAIALVANVVLNLALLPRLGVAGASVASSISYAVWLVLMGGYLVALMRTKGTPAADPPERSNRGRSADS